MSADTIDRDSAPPPVRIRIAWAVLGLRVLATGAVLLGALMVTAFVAFHHDWNMGQAAIICPEPEEVFPHTTVASVRRSSSWGNGSWCTYLAPNGRQVGETLAAEGLGETNLFEPRTSFVLSAIVVGVTWSGAVALVVLVWMVGRVIRRPRPAPPVPI